MTKLFEKSTLAATTISSFGMAQKFITYQNLAPINTTNPMKLIGSTSDNSGEIDQYYCYGL